MKDQREYWDKVAYEKEFRTPLQMALFRRYISRDAHILDYGCGYGRVLTELQAQGYTRLTGIDLSPVMIERARAACPMAALQVTDGYTIPLVDDTVDAVLLIAVLTSIPRDEDQVRLVTEIRRILRPSGYLYINDFLLNEDERNRQRYEQGQNQYGRFGVFAIPDGGVQRHHDRQWVRDLLAAFHQVDYEEMVYTTMNGNPANGFYYLGRYAERP